LTTELKKWVDRSSISTKATAALGFGYEYWHLQSNRYEGWQELRDRRKALGQKIRNREVAYDLASHLLGDVLVAAGGVEVSLLRMRAAARELQKYAEEHNIKAPPGVPTHLAGC
jgi:hypothetical protein